MGFKCGLVGLPNVGKSTLFNALTRSAAAMVGNYPFCTVEPNLAKVPLEDPRLNRLAEMSHSQKILPALLTFVDIAGLVAKASQGEGLGNKFLSHIREVDLIVHVLRCFQDNNIQHVEDRIDPVEDLEIIETELMLADMETLTKVQETLIKIQRGTGKEAKEAKEKLQIVVETLELLQKGQRPLENPPEVQLLSTKKRLYICNVDEAAAVEGNEITRRIRESLPRETVLHICAKAEAEIAQLDTEADRIEFLKEMGLTDSGLNRVVAEGYKKLSLMNFFTTGEKETRAWTLPANSTALDAAAVIHTDFAKGFIRAEVISYEDFIKTGGYSRARELGHLRSEGRKYRIQDGELLHFLFNSA